MSEAPTSALPQPRILLTRRWPAAVERHLAQLFDVVLNHDDLPLGHERLKDAMTKFDIVCATVSDRITSDVIATPGRRVRLIASYGAGTDHVDLEAARASGLVVSNTPDVLTDATAELAVLLMMMVARRVSEGERELRAGQWKGWRPTHLVGQSLRGRDLGLVGFGRIGQATARLAQKAFGARIAYYSSRRASADVEAQFDARHFTSVQALASQVDVLSLHCPANPQTFHLVNAGLLVAMKPGAILINTARGTVVDEDALAEALDQGIIAGAGLDVFEKEPAVNERLLASRNAVLLPHLGSATEDARVGMGQRVVQNIVAYLAGQTLPDRVA